MISIIKEYLYYFIMENFLIKYKSNIIGVYNDIESAKLFIKSCLSNKLMIDSADILVFPSNSCYCINTINITLETNKIEKIKSNLIKSIPVKEINYNDPKYLKLAEDKIILQHKINMLKVQKERIRESKDIYENDIKLYNKFKQEILNNNQFIIPDLFKDKFELFKKLDNENKLNWDNFIKENTHDNIYNEYFKLNSYEETFTNNDIKEDFDEIFEIDSDIEK
jgi:hypothetical protein